MICVFSWEKAINYRVSDIRLTCKLVTNTSIHGTLSVRGVLSGGAGVCYLTQCWSCNYAFHIVLSIELVLIFFNF